MTSTRDGGCACGALRYRLARVREAGVCHCRACQRASGSALVPWALVASADLALTGEATHHGGASGERRFCPTCGTSVAVRHAGDPAETWRVPLCTLDAPDEVTPILHLGCADQRRWFRSGDRLAWSDDQARPLDQVRDSFVRRADPRVVRGVHVVLREITSANLGAVLALDVAGPQRRYVATVAVSLAQHQHEKDCWVRAFCAVVQGGDEIPVGFVMCQTLAADEYGLPTKGDPYIVRFLVDERYQGQGLGRAALTALITELEAHRRGRAIWLSYVDGAESPRAFYERAGFVDTGAKDPDGEIVMRRELGAVAFAGGAR